jgi:hypothetical protein
VSGCTNWDAAHGADSSCIGGSGASHLPSALVRGGSGFPGTDAGVFAAHGFSPADSILYVGFQCAREL